MDLPITRPSNRFLVRDRDHRWPRVLTTAILLGAGLVVTLFLVGWPRLRATSIHYDLLQTREEVQRLEAVERSLRLELERERNPDRLAHRALELGLEPPPMEAIEPAGTAP